MRIVLFVNDSYFSYLLSKMTIEKYGNSITSVVISNKNKSSLRNIIRIYKKTHINYFVYRIFVQLLTCFGISGSVKKVARHRKIKIIYDKNINKSKKMNELIPADLGILLNYDQIIKKDILDSFKSGIINVHASKLPADKGISPVIWAFARGDSVIWSTIYKIDINIDSGVYLSQFPVLVAKGDTVFTVYERVCTESGRELCKCVEMIEKGIMKQINTLNDLKGNYWSWPDKTHKEMMKKSGRSFIGCRDIIKLIKYKKDKRIVSGQSGQ